MQSRRPGAPKPPRQMPAGALAAIDCLLIGLCLVVFALFDHVIPSGGTPVVDTTFAPVITSTPAPTLEVYAPQQEATATPAPTFTPEPTATPDPASYGDFSQKFAGMFTDGQVVSTDTTYKSRDLNITLTRHQVYPSGKPVVYYTEDIYIRSIDCLRTVMANDTFGRAQNEDFMNMALRSGAVAAINTDYYSVGTAGLVIRNGTMYRRELESGEELLVIFRNGDMKVYHHPASVDLDALMQEGAWQGFSFGPGLFDSEGGIQVTVKKGLYTDPRTVIGMVEPGHYVFMVADGRQDGYSDGMTYDQCAQAMQEAGCVVAYNLDGGRTSQMAFKNVLANQPVGGGRPTSDIIAVFDLP